MDGEVPLRAVSLLSTSTQFDLGTLLYSGYELLILRLRDGRRLRSTARLRVLAREYNVPRAPCCELRLPTLGDSLRGVVVVNQTPARP